MSFRDINQALVADLSAHRGQVHFWEHAMSRRQFIRTTAAGTGVAITTGLWLPIVANAHEASPRPIPGGIQPFGPGTEVFHVFLPPDPGKPQTEPATIIDFKGTIGWAGVQGTGESSDGRSWLYDADLRFMQGVFIGKDGDEHRGTFGFV